MDRWNVEFLNEAVEEEFRTLPADIRARMMRIVGIIEEHGLEHLGMPYVRHLEGKLWELRAQGKDGIGRGLYVSAKGKRVVVLRVFQKKTEKTPRSEIRLALKRAREI
jgi:phage-related protein